MSSAAATLIVGIPVIIFTMIAGVWSIAIIVGQLKAEVHEMGRELSQLPCYNCPWVKQNSPFLIPKAGAK